MHTRSIGKLKEAIKAFYDKPPDLATMQASGYEPEDFEGDEFELWPENWNSYEFFCAMQTQWNVGMNGATGLNYLVAFAFLDRMEIDKSEADQLFFDLQIMERAALEEMSGTNNVK